MQFVVADRWRREPMSKVFNCINQASIWPSLASINHHLLLRLVPTWFDFEGEICSLKGEGDCNNSADLQHQDFNHHLKTQHKRSSFSTIAAQKMQSNSKPSIITIISPQPSLSPPSILKSSDWPVPHFSAHNHCSSTWFNSRIELKLHNITTSTT